MKYRSTIFRRTLRVAALTVAGVVLGMAGPDQAAAHPERPAHHNPLPTHATNVMRAFWADKVESQALPAVAGAVCNGGSAAGYPCRNVDLEAFMPLASIGGTSGDSAANDVWGWTDPQTGKEYAIIGRVFGTSFVDISIPSAPIYLGELPTHGAFGSSWRDIKTYANHAFIVSEATNHGMQVFDLTQLRSVSDPPVTFSETAHYSGFGSAHNLAINENSGFAYGVGTKYCSGGLHMVNIQTPTSPTNAGCFSGDGYTHDAQCVIYNGPDATYQGNEICFNSNGNTLTIVDVTVKSDPVQLSRTPYPGSEYTHQSWLTENHAYLLLDDELDEYRNGVNTTTRVWNISDLNAPSVSGSFVNTTASIDHNQYVKGGFVYQANYRSGLRVLDISGVAQASLDEVAYFDIYPANDAAGFNGAWSNYPFFSSGLVVVSGIEQGLFILRPNLGPVDNPPSVTITSPAEGTTLSGTFLITANAADDDGVTQVEFFVDEVRIGVDYAEPYSASWNSGSVLEGSHTVKAIATDTAVQISSDTNNIAVVATIHVGDMDGTKLNSGKDWMAQVFVTVHDGEGNPVSGATVDGTWSGDATGLASCTTEATGTCSLTSALMPKKGTSSAVFTVDDVSPASWSYTEDDNRDPDGDSSGTAIQVNKNGTTQDPSVTNQPPTASFTYTCAVLSCDFDASGTSDADGTITSYNWDYGDGSSGSGETASHTYSGEGLYTVILTVTDTGGATDNDSQDVAVSLSSVHVGDLAASAGLSASPSGKWDATVTITVHGATENLVSGASVSGSWSSGTSGTGSCLTNVSGRCQIARNNINKNSAGVTFTVDNVTHTILSYDSGANHDPDGGTITIPKP